MSNNIVFNSFLNLLVNKDPKYTKEYIYDINKFDVWFCARGKSFSANNILNNKLDKLFKEEESLEYLYNLGTLNVENVNSEDGLPSEHFYQDEDFLNIPASAYIFSKPQYPVNCKVNKDYNYTAFDYNINDMSDNYKNKISEQYKNNPVLTPENNYDLYNLSGYSASWNHISEYFNSEYNFSSGYNSNEYSTYNINQDYLIEDQINVSTKNVSFEILPTNIIGGALLITWYDQQRTNYYYDGKNITSAAMDKNGILNQYAYKNIPTITGNCIPVCYMELPKTYNLKDAVMNIQWSENGLFSLK